MINLKHRIVKPMHSWNELDYAEVIDTYRTRADNAENIDELNRYFHEIFFLRRFQKRMLKDKD